jgi:hypothetical protein
MHASAAIDVREDQAIQGGSKEDPWRENDSDWR